MGTVRTMNSSEFVKQETLEPATSGDSLTSKDTPISVASDSLQGSWERLKNAPGDPTATEEILKHFLPLVQSELNRARAKFPRYIDIEELDTAGKEGLFMAIGCYDRKFGTTFEGYARRRIWGAILDRVRGLDGIPRTVRRANKTIDSASANFVQRNGRRPDFDELACEIGIPSEKLGKLERRAQMAKKLSLDAVGNNQYDSSSDSEFVDASELTAGGMGDPLADLADQETKALLVRGLQALSDRERSILVLHYNEGIMFNEIAAAMEVSESRVSQLHSRALQRLKRFLTTRQMQNQTDDDNDNE